MTIITEENFEAEVLKNDKPVFVDFFATWCGPCKMMGPIVDDLETVFDGEVKFAKCDIDKNMSVAQSYKIMSIPTMMVFKDGAPVMTHVGGVSKADLEGMIRGAL